MINEDERMYETFSDWQDVIEINGERIDPCQDDAVSSVWQACIEAINHSEIAYISIPSIQALCGALKSFDIVQQGDAKIVRLGI